MIRKSIVASIAVAMFFGLAALSFAQGVPILIPNYLNYQGQLVRNTDRGPMPVTGIYNMTFRIYDADGIELWSEFRPVDVKIGIFNVILGEVKPLKNYTVDPPVDLKFDKDYWLGLQVEGEPEMAPRSKIASSGYSFMAQDSYTLNGSASGKDNGLIADMVDDKHYSDIAKEIDDDIDAHAKLKTTHGVTGEIVGTSDTQTLTNKSISGEQINSGTIDDARIPDDITINKAKDSDKLGGQSPSYYAVATHTHNFSEINGTVSDAQVPDNITINTAKGMRALSGAPASPSIGEVYFNTSQNMAYIWNGSQWNEYRGPQGPQGPQGVKGDKGDNGDPGSTNFSRWISPVYWVGWDQPTQMNYVDLGNFDYCGFVYVSHDGSNGGYCDTENTGGNNWRLRYGKWGSGGIQCRLACFNL